MASKQMPEAALEAGEGNAGPASGAIKSAQPRGRMRAQRENLQASCEAGGLARFKACVEAIRSRLGQTQLRLLAELSGSEGEVIWHDALSGAPCNATLGTCPWADTQPRRAGHDCEGCAVRFRVAALSKLGGKTELQGSCGSRLHLARLEFAGRNLLTIVVQSPPESESGPGESKRERGRAKRRSRELPGAPHPARKSRGHIAKTVRGTTDCQSVAKLLEVVVHDLEATCREQLALQELEQAQARLRLVEAELACVQSGHPPAPCAATDSPTATASGDHGLAAVQRGLDCISRQFHRPLQLADVAAELHLNASYFSRLFAQITGVTFHRYLNEVRLSRAKELLRDPSQRVCEVACAVGFASADSFRRAFLHRFGVAPNHWRAAQ